MKIPMETLVFCVLLILIVHLYGVIFFASRVPRLRMGAPMLNTVDLLICAASLLFTNLDQSWIGTFVMQLTLQNAILESAWRPSKIPKNGA